MATSAELLVWMDCEMTGLNPRVDELVEVAVIITDYNLAPLDPGLNLVIRPSDTSLAQMDDVVRQMHSKSGLADQIPHGLSLGEAEQQLLSYIQQFAPEAGKAPLAGNTIGTDRAFLATHMPKVNNHLHYRNIDVSTIKELTRHWYPRIYYQAPEKTGDHRALSDILESIRELDYYRKIAFVTAPGPSSDQARAAAGEVMSIWTPRMS